MGGVRNGIEHRCQACGVRCAAFDAGVVRKIRGYRSFKLLIFITGPANRGCRSFIGEQTDRSATSRERNRIVRGIKGVELGRSFARSWDLISGSAADH